MTPLVNLLKEKEQLQEILKAVDYHSSFHDLTYVKEDTYYAANLSDFTPSGLPSVDSYMHEYLRQVNIRLELLNSRIQTLESLLADWEENDK